MLNLSFLDQFKKNLQNTKDTLGETSSYQEDASVAASHNTFGTKPNVNSQNSC